MKKLLCIALTFMLCMGNLSLFAAAEERNTLPVHSVNKEITATGIGYFSANFGKTTTTDETCTDITVVKGKITNIGGNNAEIPEDGYVISVKGDFYIKKISDVKVGDYCMYNKKESTVVFMSKDYNPFYEKTIKFDKYNTTRYADTIVIYNKGETTNTNVWGNEVTVNADGIVTVIGGNNSPIPKGGFVISAVGKGRIEELNSAAELGLEVSVDDKAKTITFAYNAESIRSSVKIKLDNANALLTEAKANYYLIDYKAAEALIAKLNGIYNDISAEIDSGNAVAALALEGEFNNEYSQLNNTMYEIPAVEGRGMWLRPAGLNSREAVAKCVAEIKEMGFNIICLELLYDSTFICPMPEDGYFIQNPTLNGFDQLQAFKDECAAQGMQLEGWLSVFRVSYSTSTYYNTSLAALKPEWLCLSKKGLDYVANEYGNGYFIDPSNSEAKEYLLSAYKYILEKYKLDGLQLDYIRYPNQANEYFGYNQGTRDAFKEKYGVDPIDIQPNAKYWDEWIDFRCDYVTEFVKEIVKTAEEVSPCTLISCAVAPNLEESRRSHLQDSKKWFEEGIVDIGYPMSYGTNVVQLYSGYTVNACGDNVFAYIGVGDYGPEVFTQQIWDSRFAGAEGFAFFSYSQYKAGDYGTIKDEVLSVPAISPSYHALTAAKAQLNVVLERLTLMKEKIGDDNYKAYTNKINAALTALETKKLSEIKADVEDICANAPEISDKNGENAIKADLKMLAKILKENRDDYRTYSYVQSEASQNTGTESETSGNTDNDGTPSPVLPIICGVAAVGAVAAVTAVAVKKKKKK